MATLAYFRPLGHISVHKEGQAEADNVSLDCQSQQWQRKCIVCTAIGKTSLTSLKSEKLLREIMSRKSFSKKFLLGLFLIAIKMWRHKKADNVKSVQLVIYCKKLRTIFWDLAYILRPKANTSIRYASARIHQLLIAHLSILILWEWTYHAYAFLHKSQPSIFLVWEA